MNKQAEGAGIEWTHIDGRSGYTWNPVAGCLHGCRWQMPDGTIAGCYAKASAEGMAQASYPFDFEHHYWHPDRLDEPLKLKTPAGIFLDSMSDLMGHWVSSEQIEQVLDICRQATQHLFFLLTKNPRRLLQFDFPDNVLVGASCPPDYFKGQRLSTQQQTRMMSLTMKTLSEVNAKIRWVSFEPLSQHYGPMVAPFADAIQWAVIGAASKGRDYFPPAEIHFRALRDVLDDQGVPIFYKGNLQCLNAAALDWREDYPAGFVGDVTKQAPVQLSLL